MKQLLQNLRSGETIVTEVPVPTPQPGTVLVRTAASLVSAGTERMVVEFAEKSLAAKARTRPDLARQLWDKAKREGWLSTIDAAFNRLDQPMPLGYSSAGTVVAVGANVHELRVGQRVACAGGGYAVHAEYAIVPYNLVARIPDDVNFDSAAFTTLGAIALQGYRLAEVQLGARVAVIGIGLLGLLTARIAQAAGCAVLGVDIDPARVEFARRIGVEAVNRSDAEAAATSFARGRGCDAVLICADTTSDDPVNLAGEIARDRATIVAVGAVGLNIPRNVYFAKELSFVNSRSYGPGRYDPEYEEGGVDYPIGYVRWTEGRNMEAIVDLLAAGDLKVADLVTHRFPIDDAPNAYELITGKTKESFLGVLLTYPGVEDASEPNGTIIDKITFSASKPRATVRLGVIGAGNFASVVLLPAMRKLDHIEFVGIASASGVSAQHAAQKYGFGYAVSSADQILTDNNINTIAILTRHNLHTEQTIAALQAGKHVICEKPLALTESELAEIWKALQQSSYPSASADEDLGGDDKSEAEATSGNSSTPLLMVGYNRRFAPFAQELKTFLGERQEPLVVQYRVNAGYIPRTHWVHDQEQGGGRIIGEACHFIDFLTYLVGAPPVSVSALGLPDAEHYLEDNVILTFNFPDGSIGSVTYLANGEKAFPKERVEVFWSGQVAVLDDFRKLEIFHAGKHHVSRSRLKQDKGHRAEWQVFVNAIRNGGPAPIPYHELFAVSQASFASVTALRTKQPIDIPQT
jgi:predicted dehydrogenase